MEHPDIGFYTESYARLGIDAIRLEMAYTEDPGMSPDGEPLSEWGSVAKKDYGTAHWYPLQSASTIQEIEQHSWPEIDGFDFNYVARKAQEKGTEYALRGPHWWPLLCRVFDLMSMEEAMVKMVLKPEVFEAALEKVFEITLESFQKLIDACGEYMPVLCAGDDFATQRGMMLSPEQWRRFLKPRYKKLFELGKKHNKYIWFHSCGDIIPVLPDLIDIGMDVWETVQLHTLSISPEQLKKQYGKHITFFGAINSQKLPFWAPQQVQAEVNRCIEILGENGGYICSADHGIRADVPFENIKTLFTTAAAFHKTGYTL
jgi:uroporphyrinogen decarboxylase